jgi:hypothetical protein
MHMAIALDYFMQQIQALEQRLGFPIRLDDTGNCVIELENGLVLGITFSTVDDRYGLHCFLLTAPAGCSQATCTEALRLNLELASMGTGLLSYTDDGEGITYTWTDRCREHAPPLEEKLLAAANHIHRLHQRLLDVRNAEYSRQLSFHDVGFRSV